MKKTLALSQLAILSGYLLAELARSYGIQVPASVNGLNTTIAFAVAAVVAVMFADYGPKVRPIPLPVPAARTKCAYRHSIAAAYHHVYAIRRGAEAARLAHPSTSVIHFPRTDTIRTKRAA